MILSYNFLGVEFEHFLGKEFEQYLFWPNQIWAMDRRTYNWGVFRLFDFMARRNNGVT